MFQLLMCIIFGYIGYSIFKYNCIPNSISETFYLGNSWGFTMVMWILGFLLSFCLLQVTCGLYQFLIFLSSSGLLLVGASPHFRESLEGNVHYLGASLYILGSQIWAALYFSPWLLLLWLTLVLWINKKQRIFYAELLSIVIMCLAYLL